MGTCGLGDVLGLAQATDGLSASARAAQPFGRLSCLNPRLLLLVLDTYAAHPGDTEPQSTVSDKPPTSLCSLQLRNLSLLATAQLWAQASTENPRLYPHRLRSPSGTDSGAALG